ncbi:DUF4250 domain-containing protein [Anaerolentibacter hominis]|uniref:DUF4250 domain-containing protein n=1 Tax=Anaerolentibacter hominis TaxID=3079009 RepID=UPI0031B82C49
MYIPKDPIMLLSFTNMKLRDQYSSLDKLCDDLKLNKDELLQKMSAIDYEYIPEMNQFR